MASTTATSVGYHDIPVELKREICVLLPRSKLKDIRIVNKEWGSIAASLLFSVFNTNLVETRQRRLAAMLVSPAGGLLDSVRELNIVHQEDGRVPADKDNKILQLLCVLPHNCLSGLSSIVPLHVLVVGLLLRTQTKLRRLSVPIEYNKQICPPPGKRYINGNLQFMESLTIFATGHDEDGYAAWLPDLSALRRLRVSGVNNGTQHKPSFNGWKSLALSPTLKLNKLYLRSIRLPETPSDIVKCINLPSLQKLFIMSCLNSGPFLAFVAQQLAGSTDTSALKVLRQGRERIEGPLKHIEDLLKSVSGLESLILDVDGANPLAISSLQSHGTSLKVLLLGFSKDRGSRTANMELTDSLYAVKDLTQLVDTCPHLHVLGISLANIDFRGWPAFRSVGISLSPSRTTPKGLQIAQALQPLARLKELRTLCFTHTPYMRFQNNAAERYYRHQSLATEIFLFMNALGSTLRYIVFHPAGKGWNPNTSTVGGSTWPNFYYCKANVIAADGAGPKYDGVVALSMSRAELADVEPHHEALMKF
ncbi:Nn.00g079080.m01.CDS01 [Neocucurbitaria sp. VM-36]